MYINRKSWVALRFAVGIILLVCAIAKVMALAPPTLNWYTTPSGLVLDWAGPFVPLQADMPVGPWAPANITSGTPIAMTAQQKYYALQLSTYWTDAVNVHQGVVNNYQTPYYSYSVQPGSTLAYTWYCASQIYADAAMVPDDPGYLSYVTNTYNWMSNLWDFGSSIGGYFAAANIDGSGAGGDKYVDDNALTGNVYLDCYQVTTGVTKTNFLESAEAIANWLMYSGLWDNTFGGGFWWNTTKQLKPTQSNGLAEQLFLRLYQITGQSYYASWANSINSWLNSQMFNSTNGLYVWQIVTNGTPEGEKSYIEFAYDNAIMIEANLLYYQVMNASAYKTNAENLARSLNNVLWNNTYGSYYFNTANGSVNPTWCGWVSQSLIKLYQADGDTNWLNYAQRNVDYMNKYLLNTNNYGYYYFGYMGGGGVTTNDMEGVDQAWMQRIQTLLSNYR